MSSITDPVVIAFPTDSDASGRSLGEEELVALAEAIRNGRLTSTGAVMVRRFEAEVARSLDVEHAIACSSGSAAMHAAIAAVDPNPGDEIVTTPLTDMGALTPILAQGAIPVFADVDPSTATVTAETISRCLSSRTRAIVVTHLFGNPCAMRDILSLAETRGLPVIEDCAQAWMARHDGRPVGTMGAIGCFSLQQTKHITTGEGGIIVTRDPTLAKRMLLFINKGWPYGEPGPDHESFGLNYRMTELQGAVALAQFAKLPELIERRVTSANVLSELLGGIRGLRPMPIAPGSECTYWRYVLLLDERDARRREVVRSELMRLGVQVPATQHFRKPAFLTPLFQTQKTFGDSRYPFNLARPEAVDYDEQNYRGVFEAIDRMLVLGWNERYTAEHARAVAAAIRHAFRQTVEDQVR